MCITDSTAPTESTKSYYNMYKKKIDFDRQRIVSGTAVFVIY